MPPNYRRIDWANPENNDRLVAAVLAAQGMKVGVFLSLYFSLAPSLSLSISRSLDLSVCRFHLLRMRVRVPFVGW